MRMFYLAFPIWNAVRSELGWTHYCILMRENDLDSKLVALVNAKRSNGPKYTSRAVRLNTDYMTYDTVKHLDVDQALRDLKSEATKPEQNKADVRAKQYEDMKKKVIDIVKPLLEKGVVAKSVLEGHLVMAGIPDRNINRMLSVVIGELGYETATNPLEKNAVYYGTHEKIAAFRSEIEAKQAEKAAEKRTSKLQKNAKKSKKK